MNDRAHSPIGLAVAVVASAIGGACGDSERGDPAAEGCPDGQTECGEGCVSLDDNSAHCGSCGNACGAGQSCTAGKCACGDGQTRCGEDCVDLESDPDHCGACATACAADQVCSGSRCGDSCATGETNCDRACVDIETDPAHCGACGNACTGGRLCRAGSCECDGDRLFCGGACIDTSSDPSHCGACDAPCGSGQTCSQGTCVGTSGGGGGSSGTGGSSSGTGGSSSGSGGESADSGGHTSGGTGPSSTGGGALTGGGPATGGSPPVPTPSSCDEPFEEDGSCSGSQGTTFYVSSSSGSDDADGLSEATALATVGAVNALELLPGDRVLFKCGDTWDLEQLHIRSSGEECAHIVFGSYPAPCPAGAAPTLDGRREITGWTASEANVWVSSLSEGANAGRFPRGINQLFQNGSRLPMGVWPNPGEIANGFSYIDRHDGAVIEDDELPAADWTGAVLRMRPVRWLLVNRQVTAASSPALTLNDVVSCYADTCGDPNPSDAADHGFGYQLTDHRATLDRPGEWYYDPASSSVYLVSSAAPENISGSVVAAWADQDELNWDFDGAVRLGTHLEAHVHHVVVENLAIEGYFGSGISTPVNLETDEIYDVVLRCNTIAEVEARGINLQTWVWNHPSLSDWYGGRNLVVQGNIVTGPNHYGIQSYAQNSVFEDNVVTDIGRLENLGRRGLGCEFTGDNCTEHGDGIHVPVSVASINSHDLVFARNTVARTAYCGFDIFGSAIRLEQNLIEEACFTKADCGAVRTFGAEGDSPAHDIVLDHNIVVRPIGNVDGGGMGFDTPMAFGFYIDMYSSAVTSSGNTIIDAPSSGILYQNSNGTIEGNTLFDTATDGGQAINAPDGTVSNNIEVSTATEPNAEIFFNATAVSATQDLTSSYLDLDGAAVSGSVTLAPYESVILIRQ